LLRNHVRRPFYELAAAGLAPIASEALERIAALYTIEKDIRGLSADERRAVRQDKSRQIIDDLESWLRAKPALISQKTKLAQAIRYALSRWNGLTRFLDDGRIEIDSNVVERSIRPIALNRKNALFAGSDGGGKHWAAIAPLIETCKLNRVDSHAYLTDPSPRSSTAIPTAASTSSCDGIIPQRGHSKAWPENSAYDVAAGHSRRAQARPWRHKKVSDTAASSGKPQRSGRTQRVALGPGTVAPRAPTVPIAVVRRRC
jgi:hypothetical protein